MGRKLAEIESLGTACEVSLCTGGLTPYQCAELVREARRMITVQRRMADKLAASDREERLDAAEAFSSFGKKPGPFDDIFGTMFGGKKP